MFRVVLIDDEPWSLVSIKNAFNWEKYNMRIIAEFDNAREAMSFLYNNNVDVVFSDIRMPGMTGLELLNTVRSNDMDIVFVMISGFADFNYVQQALRNGAFDYFLKPVSKEDAEQLLEKLSSHLYLEKYEASNSVINEIKSGRCSISSIYKKNKVSCCMKYYQVLNIYTKNRDFNFTDINIPNMNYITLPVDFNNHFIIANTNEDLFDAISKNAYIMNNIDNFFVGISTLSQDDKDIAHLFNEASLSASKWFISPEADRINKYGIGSPKKVLKFIDKIGELVRSLKFDELYEYIDKLPQIFAEQNLDMKDVLFFWNNTVTLVNSEFESTILWKDFTNLNHNDIMSKFSSFAHMCESLEEFFLSLSSSFTDHGNSREANVIIQELLDYVDENYSSQLHLKDIANIFHINYTYCCELFKKTCGTNFSEYLNNLRMKKASELLISSHMPIKDIAMESGFTDYYYFNNVFKRYFGITPLKYRNNHCDRVGSE